MSIATDILNRADINSGVNINYRLTNKWYDGSPLDDSKIDGDIYRKKDNAYYQKTIDTNTLLKINTIEDLRNQNGYYEGQEVSLLGYYDSGDKRALNYKFTINNYNSYIDDGGSVIKSSKGSWIAVFSGSIDVKDFGAVGNFNSNTQTGIDDTDAIQKAINFLRTYTDIRQGQGRRLFFPSGGYLLKHIDISGFDFQGEGQFHLHISGESEYSTMLFFDEEDERVGIDNKEEAVLFSNISLNGSKYFPAEPSQRKDLIIKAKKWSGHADVDITFKDCNLSNFNTFLDVYGRGVIFDNCNTGLGGTLINIVCSEDMIWDNTDPFGIHSMETGMRHYIIRNSRVDGTSVLIDITGTGAQKDYINGIVISNNHGTGPDRVIRSQDCTLRNPQLLVNDFRECCRFGVVTVPNVYDAMDIGNSWKSAYNPNKPLTNDSQCISSVWECDNIYGLNFSSLVNNIRFAVIHAKIKGENIKVVNSEFPNFLDYKGGNSDGFVVYSPNNIEGLIISDNVFNSENINGNYLYHNRTAQLLSSKTIINNNISNFNWDQSVFKSYTPIVYAGDNVSAVSAKASVGFSQNEVFVSFVIFGSFSGASGEISINLPISAKAMFPDISGSYAGGGKIIRYSNLNNSLDKNIESIIVDSSTQKAYFTLNSNNLVQSNMQTSDVNDGFSIFGEFKYFY